MPGVRKGCFSPLRAFTNSLARILLQCRLFSLPTAMSRADVHTRFGSPGSPNRPKRARSDRNNLPRARTRARVDRSCRWCSHDDANRGHGGSCTVAGDIPLDIAGLERMCFGDIIKRAQESSTALEAAICDPRSQDLPKHAIVVRNTGGPQNVWFLHRSLEPLSEMRTTNLWRCCASMAWPPISLP